LGIRRRWKELAEITVLTRADCKAWVGHCQQTKRPPCGRQGTKGSASIRMYHDNHPKAGLSGRKRVGLSVLRTDSEPCEVLVWHSERDSGDKLRADRRTQISSACPLIIPTFLLPHTTQTNYNNDIRTKTFQAQHSFLNRRQLLGLPSTTSPATTTATDCVTQAAISPSLNSP